MATPKKTVYQSAKTGKFVTKSYAKRHKSTTFGQRVPRKRGAR